MVKQQLKMDLSTSISIIIQDLNRACEIIDDLKKYPGVPLLQIELAKSKCRSAADVISLLPGLGTEALEQKPTLQQVNTDITPLKNRHDDVEQEKISVIPVAAVTKETAEPHLTAKAVETPVDDQPAEQTVVQVTTPVSFPESTYDTIPAVEILNVPDAGAVESEAEVVHGSNGSGILADQFNNLSKSFNEELGNMKHEEDIAGKLRSKPLNDLSDAIGVNDRFVFIREIFNGSYETYARAISELNSAGSMSDARQVLEGYTTSKSENEAVRQLMELVKRRFQIHG